MLKKTQRQQDSEQLVEEKAKAPRFLEQLKQDAEPLCRRKRKIIKIQSQQDSEQLCRKKKAKGSRSEQESDEVEEKAKATRFSASEVEKKVTVTQSRFKHGKSKKKRLGCSTSITAD